MKNVHLLGCYSASGGNVSTLINSVSRSVLRCMQSCDARGAPYAALSQPHADGRAHCHCGNALPPSAPPARCTATCKDDDLACGAKQSNDYVSVYEHRKQPAFEPNDVRLVVRRLSFFIMHLWSLHCVSSSNIFFFCMYTCACVFVPTQQGCFVDNPADRDLPKLKRLSAKSPGECLRLCVDIGN